MKPLVFEKRSRIHAPADAVFRWHTLPETLGALIPPWEAIEVHERTGTIGDGARIVFMVRIGPIRRRWVSVHRDYVDGRSFKDVQLEGPFAFWEHTHDVLPDGTEGCWLIDRIAYVLPFGALGRLLAGVYVRRKLDRLFDYRHRVTARAFSPTV